MLMYPQFENFSVSEFKNEALAAGAALGPELFSHLFFSGPLLKSNWTIDPSGRKFQSGERSCPCVKLGRLNHKRHEFIFADSQAVQDIMAPAEALLPDLKEKVLPCDHSAQHAFGIIGAVIGLQTTHYMPLLIPAGPGEEDVFLLDFGTDMPIPWDRPEDILVLRDALEELPDWFDPEAALLSTLDFLDIIFREVQRSPEERGVLITIFNPTAMRFEEEFIRFPERLTSSNVCLAA